ncbi:unnamed protein product [Effrenium voratum]|nr:unnamed protein product [Effrenium voratum]
MVFSTTVQPCEDSEWPKVVATSPWMRPSFYLVFRGVWAAVFLGHLIAHIASHDEGAYYLIYLTTWALITQTISEMLLFSLAILGYRRLSGPPPEKLPVAVRIEVALWSAVHPVAVVVWLLPLCQSYALLRPEEFRMELASWQPVRSRIISCLLRPQANSCFMRRFVEDGLGLWIWRLA